MPRRIPMIELRDMVLRLRRGEGIKSLHRATGRHKTILRKLKALASALGWLEPGNHVPAENDIQAAWLGKGPEVIPEKPHALDAIQDEIKGWVYEKYSYIVIHKLAAERVPCSESTIRRYIHSRFGTVPKAVVPRTALPGVVMEVDFGLLGFVMDDVEGRKRKAWVF
jgi:hypothetical protein